MLQTILIYEIGQKEPGRMCFRADVLKDEMTKGECVKEWNNSLQKGIRANGLKRDRDLGLTNTQPQRTVIDIIQM
jgi:hypothetical protein